MNAVTDAQEGERMSEMKPSAGAYVIRKAQQLDRQPTNIAKAPWCLYLDYGPHFMRPRLGTYPTRRAAIADATRLDQGRGRKIIVEQPRDGGERLDRVE